MIISSITGVKKCPIDMAITPVVSTTLFCQLGISLKRVSRITVISYIKVFSSSDAVQSEMLWINCYIMWKCNFKLYNIRMS